MTQLKTGWKAWIASAITFGALVIAELIAHLPSKVAAGVVDLWRWSWEEALYPNAIAVLAAGAALGLLTVAVVAATRRVLAIRKPDDRLIFREGLWAHWWSGGFVCEPYCPVDECGLVSKNNYAISMWRCAECGRYFAATPDHEQQILAIVKGLNGNTAKKRSKRRSHKSDLGALARRVQAKGDACKQPDSPWFMGV